MLRVLTVQREVDGALGSRALQVYICWARSRGGGVGGAVGEGSV